jgi:Recombination endonuclease VII
MDGFQMKQCRKCLTSKSLDNFGFSKSRKDGHQDWCKPCRKEYHSINVKRHREICWKNDIRNKYNLTVDEYDEILKRQDYKCAICGNTSPNRKLAIDHNHKTKEIRGLLCGNCNRGIGHLKDSVDILQKAVKYLQERGSYE